MAARRCALHGSFPAAWDYTKCPVCEEPTIFLMDGEPDEFWEQNVARHKERMAQADAPVEEIPTLDGAKVVLDGGKYYVSTWDVVNGGVRHRLRFQDLIQVGKQVFEVLEYQYENRRYWVAPFSTSLSDEQLSELAGP